MVIERVRVPLGVVAVIFESRPNVAADAGVLCLKSGNAVDPARRLGQFRSCRAIQSMPGAGPAEAGLPEASITLVRPRPCRGRLLLSGLKAASRDVPRRRQDPSLPVSRRKRGCRCSRI